MLTESYGSSISKAGSVTSRAGGLGLPEGAGLKLPSISRSGPEVSLWAASVKQSLTKLRGEGSVRNGDASNLQGRAPAKPAASALLVESVAHLHVEGDLPPTYAQMQQMQEVVVGKAREEAAPPPPPPSLPETMCLVVHPEAPILSKVREWCVCQTVFLFRRCVGSSAQHRPCSKTTPVYFRVFPATKLRKTQFSTVFRPNSAHCVLTVSVDT